MYHITFNIVKNSTGFCFNVITISFLRSWKRSVSKYWLKHVCPSVVTITQKRVERFRINLAWGSLWSRARSLLIFRPRVKVESFQLRHLNSAIESSCHFRSRWPPKVTNWCQRMQHQTYIGHVTYHLRSFFIVNNNEHHHHKLHNTLFQLRRYDCSYSVFITFAALPQFLV